MPNGPDTSRRSIAFFAALERVAIRDAANLAVVSMRLKLGLPIADRADAVKGRDKKDARSVEHEIEL